MVPIEQAVTVFALITLIPVVVVIVQGVRYNSLTNEIEWLRYTKSTVVSRVDELEAIISDLEDSRSVLRSAADGMFQIIAERDEIISDLNSALEKANDEPPSHVRVQVSDSDIWHVFTDLYVALVFVHASQTTFPDLSFKIEAVKGIKVAGIEL